MGVQPQKIGNRQQPGETAPAQSAEAATPEKFAGETISNGQPELQDRLQSIRNDVAAKELAEIFAKHKVLKVGSTGPEVAVVKDALARLGLYVDPTQSALLDTDADRIREYQESSGLAKVDGKIGRETLFQINSDLLYRGLAPLPSGFDPSKMQPMTSGHYDGPGVEIIVNAQRALNRIFDGRKDLPFLEEDGAYGKITKQRVAQFQRERGLKADGQLDPKTLRVMQYDLGVKSDPGEGILLPGESGVIPENSPLTKDVNVRMEAATQPGVLLPEVSPKEINEQPKESTAHASVRKIEPAPKDAPSITPAAEPARAWVERVPEPFAEYYQKTAQYLNSILGREGAASQTEADYVNLALSKVPDMLALDSIYYREMGSSLMADIKKRLSGVDLTIAQAYFWKGVRWVTDEAADQVIDQANRYRKVSN